MHILLVSHYVLPHSGGIEVLVDQLGRRLALGGDHVTIVSSRIGSAIEDERGDGRRVLRVPAANFLERWLDVPYPIFSPRLLRVMRDAVRDADVVHVHGLLYLGSLSALLWAGRMGKPLVVTEHVGLVPYRAAVLNWIQRAAFAAVTRPFLRRADAVVSLNRAVYDWLARRMPDPQRLHFIPNGVDTDRFHPATGEERRAARQRFGVGERRPVALFVGRFVEKKRLDVLLETADGSFDLLLCGRGELPPGTERKARVLRDVDHAEMAAVYHAADFLVLPSCGEGFPIAIMEAMACGLPVVAVRDPTYSAYASDEEMIQTAADAAALRDAIHSVAANADERQRRGGAARRRALEHFSLAVSARRHREIYERVRRSPTAS